MDSSKSIEFGPIIGKKGRYAVVITSIYEPTEAVFNIANKNSQNGFDFIVVGDKKSPLNYNVQYCSYYSLEQQQASHFKFGALCPIGHYARKNMGYLLAIARGCDYLLETDDDNIPLDKFWEPPSIRVQASFCDQQGWINVYRYFSETLIWPRGLPLSEVNSSLPPWDSMEQRMVACPIQQGLANENPDVDAIYRLILPLPQSFSPRGKIALGKEAWCPFNSQNTIWFREAYPLLYLPSFCSFRMTDIWRSFVAQRIAWENAWSILFTAPTVYQRRNEHDLMKDFEEEISGYLHNESIRKALQKLPLKPGLECIPANMLHCYTELVDLNLIDSREIQLLEAWLEDLAELA
jgi:hypothetical protein